MRMDTYKLSGLLDRRQIEAKLPRRKWLDIIVVRYADDPGRFREPDGRRTFP
jgi:hypothetical protein